jgi:hypothetical protein
VRRAAILLLTLSACVPIRVAGAAPSSSIVPRSTVTALAADGTDVAFSAARNSVDCDRVFIWQRPSGRTFQLGKHQRCALHAAPIDSVAVSGGRALWLTSTAGKTVDSQLWTASATRRTPRLLQFESRQPGDPRPIVVGSAGGGLLPYAVDSTVTTLKANGSTAFSWDAATSVVALAATDGRVAVAETQRVTVLDAHGDIVSVDLYAGPISAVAFVPKGLIVQRGAVLELRRGADAHEFATTVDSRLADASGNWAAWGDGKLVHVLHLPDGVQKAMYGGSLAAFAGSRLYVANGRTITVRTIR